MRSIATDVARSVVCVSVCVDHADVLCKTAKPIDMPFRGLTFVSVDPRNHVLHEDRDSPH